MSNDGELLVAWRNGDGRAGEELFQRHYPSVLRFYRNKVKEEHVADLVQQTFLACVEGAAKVRDTEHFRAYLFSVARNLLYQHLRGKYRDNAHLDPTTVSVRDLAPGPRSQVGRQREHRLLLEALRTLPIETQLMLELRYWEGMKTHEIAIVMDMPHATVRTRLHRAHGKLEQALAELAASPSELSNTLTRLDDWALQVREGLGQL